MKPRTITPEKAHHIAMRTLLRAEAERYPEPRRRWTDWMWRLCLRIKKARR